MPSSFFFMSKRGPAPPCGVDCGLCDIRGRGQSPAPTVSIHLGRMCRGGPLCPPVRLARGPRGRGQRSRLSNLSADIGRIGCRNKNRGMQMHPPISFGMGE